MFWFVVMDDARKDVEGGDKSVWRQGKSTVFIEGMDGVESRSEGGAFP